MLRRIALLALASACGGSNAGVRREVAAGREPKGRTYYAIVGLPGQSFAATGTFRAGESWIALGQAPYALQTATDGRVELLSPLAGPGIPKMENWDEPMGTVRTHLEPGKRGVEATYRLTLGERSAQLVVSIDPFQPCDPNTDGIAKQIEVRQEGCFLETGNCKGTRTLAAQPDGTFGVGPLRVSIAVICMSVAYAL